MQVCPLCRLSMIAGNKISIQHQETRKGKNSEVAKQKKVPVKTSCPFSQELTEDQQKRQLQTCHVSFSHLVEMILTHLKNIHSHYHCLSFVSSFAVTENIINTSQTAQQKQGSKLGQWRQRLTSQRPLRGSRNTPLEMEQVSSSSPGKDVNQSELCIFFLKYTTMQSINRGPRLWKTASTRTINRMKFEVKVKYNTNALE